MESLTPPRVPLTPHELEARGTFYVGLAGLQSKLTPDSTLLDALSLMPVYGLAWYYANNETVLGHSEGHEVRLSQSTGSWAEDLSFLLGLPSLVVDASGDEYAATPAPTPEPEAEPAPAPEPEPAAVAPESPTAEPETESEPEPAPEPVEDQPDDPSLSTRRISPEDANTARSMVAELSTAQKTTFKKAFCETFAISPAPLRIAGLITEERHAEFVRRFVDEAEGVARP